LNISVFSRKLVYIYFKFTPMPRNLVFLLLLFVVTATYSQEISRHSDLLVTFGNMSGDEVVDDDFSQVVFCAVPANHPGDIWIRIYDPDCGGVLDRVNGLWETNTLFAVYGGRGCITDKDARGVSPTGNYASGKLLQQEIFAEESEVDGQWVTLGPFTTADGEQVEAFPGYVFFKLLVEGQTGNDGNVYSLFLSQRRGENSPVPHAALFTFERIVLKGDHLTTIHADEGILHSEKVELPLQLDVLPKEPGFNVIAEPINE
jgi:hypothetical protein